MITNHTRYTRVIKSRIAMAKAVFNKEVTLFTSKFDLNLRKNATFAAQLCMVLILGHFGK
jgi:hypothetical protein